MSLLTSDEYKKTLVAPQTSILDTISTIDTAGLQIALVVDEGGVLVGTVTDGDVRRGLLSGAGMSDPIEGVMNKTPVTVSQTMAKAEILEIMEKYDVRQIPITDEDGRLIGFENRKSLTYHEYGDVKIVLMLGGQGTRLRPLTQDTPKPMLQVGDKPLLENIVASFKKQGFHQFIFSLNYHADIIRDHFGDGSDLGVEIDYVLEDEPMGTAGALGLIESLSDGPFIVMNGDILTNVDFRSLVDFHNQNKTIGTMCVREYTHEVPYGIVQNDGTELGSIVEKPTQSYFVNAGIYVLDPACLPHIAPREYLDMPQLFELLREKGHVSSVFPIREYWLDIGRPEDLDKARQDFKQVFG